MSIDELTPQVEPQQPLAENEHADLNLSDSEEVPTDTEEIE